MATKLYLRDSANAEANMPTGEQSTALPNGSASSPTFTKKNLLQTIGSSQVQITHTHPAESGVHRDGVMSQWISRALYANNITAQTWTIALAGLESSAFADTWHNFSLYVWRPSTQAVVGYIRDVHDGAGGSPRELGTSNTGAVWTISGSAVSGIADGDRIIFEWWHHWSHSMSSAYTSTISYGGTTEPVDNTASSSAASYISTPQDIFLVTGSASGSGTGSSTCVGTPKKVASASGSATSSSTAVGLRKTFGVGAGTAVSSSSVVAVLSRYASASGSGVASSLAVGLRKTFGVASGSGVASSLAVGLRKTFGVASGSGTSSSSAIGLLKIYGVASGSGTSSSSAIGLLKLFGVASGSGTSNSSAIGLLKIYGVASGSGTSSSSAIGLLKLFGVASGSGTSSSICSGTIEVIVIAPKKIVWDNEEDRIYETGLDRGVLYLGDKVIPWNGLVSVEELNLFSIDSYFYEGNKFLDYPSNDGFEARIKALTYPDEFELYSGYDEIETGVSATGQKKQYFGMSYRTLIGNAVDGNNFAYKIHILYNLIATPGNVSYNTVSSDNDLSYFDWTIKSVPTKVDGFAHTSYVVVDSRYLDSEDLSHLEGILYGTESLTGRLPSLSTLIAIIPDHLTILIIDNGDGTWTADGPNELITMLDETTFQITNANAIYLDGDTYTISSS